jgi:hypothetical protein
MTVKKNKKTKPNSTKNADKQKIKKLQVRIKELEEENKLLVEMQAKTAEREAQEKESKRKPYSKMDEFELADTIRKKTSIREL